MNLRKEGAWTAGSRVPQKKEQRKKVRGAE